MEMTGTEEAVYRTTAKAIALGAPMSTPRFCLQIPAMLT